MPRPLAGGSVARAGAAARAAPDPRRRAELKGAGLAESQPVK